MQISKIFKLIRRRIPIIFINLLAKERKNNKLSLNFQSIIIFSQDKIGDFILITPLLYSLKKYFPKINLIVLAPKYNYKLYKELPVVDNVIKIENSKFSFYRRLKKKKFDILYNPKDHSSRTSLLLTTIIKAKFKIGHKHFMNSRLYDFLFPFSFDEHIVDKNLKLFQLLNIKLTYEDRRSKLPVKGNDKVNNFYKNIGKSKIGINLSAGSKEREWKTENWEEFITSFKQNNISFILLGMPDKLTIIKEMCKRHNNIYSPTNIENIFELNNYISKLDFLITPDTSVFHLGQINNIKTIGLFQNRKINIHRYVRDNTKTTLVFSDTENINRIKPEKLIKEFNKFLTDESDLS